MSKSYRLESKLGFSMWVPNGWESSEKIETVVLAEKEKLRQERWLRTGEGEPPDVRLELIFGETLSGLSTGLQGIEGDGRGLFYEKFFVECGKLPAEMLKLDKTNVAQIKFLITSVNEVSKEWPGIDAKVLLITLQKMTDRDRLKAKEALGTQIGYLEVGDSKDKNNPTITIIKFNTNNIRTAHDLYSQYKSGLPTCFWSGIPDKIDIIQNKTVANNTMVQAKKFLIYDETDSMDTYAVKGRVGWVISCTALDFNKYQRLFDEAVRSFCVC